MLAAIVLAGATIACGNPLSTAEETQTAVAGVATPGVIQTPGSGGATPEATATAGLSTGPTLAAATPAPVTPIASGQVDSRPDCPSGHATFRDVSGKLSVCAPASLRAVTDVDEIGAPGLLLTSDDATGVPQANVPQVLVAVRFTSRRLFNPDVPLDQLCAKGSGLSDLVSGAAVSLSIAGRTATGCDSVGETHSIYGPLELLQLTISLAAPDAAVPEFLNLDVSWRTQSQGASELAHQIVQSLRIAP
jgi:hypothetical protein